MTEVKEFLDDYNRAWQAAIASKDVGLVTRFFHVPYLAVGPDGAVTVSSSEADIRRFNEGRLAQFLKDQAPRWILRGVDGLSLGTQGVFAIVNWEGQRADGTVARAWRHYYNLVRTAGGLKILVSTFSAGSHG